MASPTSTTRLYASARAKAVRRLMDAHDEEYQRIYAEECAAAGLGNPDEAKAIETLEALGYTVTKTSEP